MLFRSFETMESESQKIIEVKKQEVAESGGIGGGKDLMTLLREFLASSGSSGADIDRLSQVELGREQGGDDGRGASRADDSSSARSSPASHADIPPLQTFILASAVSLVFFLDLVDSFSILAGTKRPLPRSPGLSGPSLATPPSKTVSARKFVPRAPLQKRQAEPNSEAKS